MKFSTIAIHTGQAADKETGAVIPPIYVSSTYAQEAPGVDKGYDYSRAGNPTRKSLEEALCGLEGGARGFAFASGTGALTTLLMALLNAGDHIIVGDDVYGGTFRFIDKVIQRFGVSATFVDMTNAQNVASAITDKTRMVFLESPTNPMLKLTDLTAMMEITKSHNLLSCVDNTFATPYLQQPLSFGVDVVLHSTTKYINGHSDVVGGALITREDGEVAEKIGFHQNAIGATPDPLASWLTLRGMKTLAVRMRAHVEGATALAKFLDGHAHVAEVIYPGLPSHPQYDLAQSQMKAAGGMISMRLKGDGAQTTAFLQKLKLFALAESLGGVESLISVPALMTHASVSEEARAKLGITDTLVRISVGIEDAEDLIADLDAALNATFA